MFIASRSPIRVSLKLFLFDLGIFFDVGRQTLSRQIRTLPDRIYKSVHSPFSCHHAGAIPGPATSTDYISQIGAQPTPHDWQRNQQ